MDFTIKLSLIVKAIKTYCLLRRAKVAIVLLGLQILSKC